MVTLQGITFYSIEEAAKLIGVSKRTLYNWNWKNKTGPDSVDCRFSLNAVTSPSGRKFFREDEIVALLSKSWGIEVTPESLRKQLNSNKKSPNQ